MNEKERFAMRVENDSDPKGVGEDADLSSNKERILPRLIPTAAVEGNAQAHSSQSIGRWISVTIVAATVVVGLVVLRKTTHHPRTDDAAVLANYIGIAPQVEGPLVRLPVHDNQFVKKGELLFEIDDRPYQYALERALSEQAALEGQIADETRRIAAPKSAVSVAESNIRSAEAEVVTAEQGVSRAQAEWAYASNNLQRLEPLLAKHFVTMDDIDKAKTSELAQQEAPRQAQSHLLLARSQVKSGQAQHEQAGNARSEERRVGKECRSRWSPYH